jgi:hypothetical protein
VEAGQERAATKLDGFRGFSLSECALEGRRIAPQVFLTNANLLATPCYDDFMIQRLPQRVQGDPQRGPSVAVVVLRPEKSG